MVFERKQMVPVSILMCVYKRERFLPEAIESILDQTFTDFEFVIVVDGATDGILKIVNSYANKDARIKLVINKENAGIARATASGLMHCSGKYIALMDSDDISLPGRFQTQYDYLEGHPGIDALGSGLVFIDEEGNRTGKSLIRPVDPLVIRFELFYRCVVHNPTIMAKADYICKFNADRAEESFDTAQDYAFWLRTNFDHLFSNLPEPVLLYRLHSHQMSNTLLSLQREKTIILVQTAFEKLLGRPIAKEVIEAFYFSLRHTITDARIVRKGLQTMFQAQQAFERANPLTKDQKNETRTFSYEKIKSYAIKYKKMKGVLLIGMVYLLRLMPVKLFTDALNKMMKLDVKKDRPEEIDELEIL